MSLVSWRVFGLGVLLATACNEEGDSSSGAFGSLAAEEGKPAPGVTDTDGREFASEFALDAGTDAATRLRCPRGGETGPIRVVFRCHDLTVLTCKDLSNVVLELGDGSHFKVEGLHGHENDFVAPDGHTIVGVWVKSGQNHSGDGPGYGQRFAAPTGTCSPSKVPTVDRSVPPDAATVFPQEPEQVVAF
jgi:hypothetical protein